MSCLSEFQKWLNSTKISEEERLQLLDISMEPDEVESRFCSLLEFGTAGLRGIMGLGINRMNRYVVRHTTQAFADVIALQGPEAMARGVGICHDCRLGSREFAKDAASVFAANGIKSFVFDELRPTPELSFAIREYGYIAGINITASHNPKEYNGYKVYWEDGAQLPPAHASAVSSRMAEIDVFSAKTMDYGEGVARGLIGKLGAETDERFLKRSLAEVIDRDAVAKVADSFKIVYTPFHGCGYRLVPEALRRLGLRHVLCVPEQMMVDGNFPTVKSPNPEEREGFALALELARENGVDLIIATDPDADRVGTMVKNSKGEYVNISGNQMGALLLDYIINARRRTGTLPTKAAAVKTIVTTEMARKIADDNGVAIFDTFTGFKFIAEKIKKFEVENSFEFIMGYEESYGYMIGSFVRDKDAVTASVLIAEMAAWYFGMGMTLYDALEGLFRKYGWYMENTLNLMFPGLSGMKKMGEIMDRLRISPPAEIAGTPVERVRDYRSGEIRSLRNGAITKTGMESSNVLYFELEDGSSFIIRPSGTEPKIKVYVMVRGGSEADAVSALDKYSKYAQTLNR